MNGAMAQAGVTPSSLAAGGNVLIVVLDDIGIEALEAYGEGQVSAPTPNVDALAANGVLFRYAYGNPFCSPTRATLQTGRFGFRTGIGNIVTSSSWALQTSEVTLPELLRKGGRNHADAAFGKWHLGNNSVGGRYAPNRAGWSHFAGELMNSQDYFSWQKIVNGQGYQATGYLTTDQVQDAIDWIQAQDRAWLCYLAVTAAHEPLHAPPGHLHGFSLSNGAPGVGEDPLPYFHAMIEALDTELGRLFDVIDFATTHVILVGDNGSTAETIVPPFTSSQNKGSVYEGGTRVPLIVRSPIQVEPGRTVNAMVNTVDVLASVADLLWIDLEPLGLPVHDSISFVPYLKDPDQGPRRKHAFSENFKPLGLSGPYTVLKRALRDQRYKLITELGVPDELYDLLLDPYEHAPLNLAALTPEQQAAYDALQAALDALLAS
jgi:arylsulfatase A-like enzyme